MDNNFCAYCGAKVTAPAKYCTKCGKEINLEHEASEEENSTMIDTSDEFSADYGSNDMMYYLAIDGTRQGPFSKDTVEKAIISGDLKPHYLIWKEGMPQWLPLGTMGEFQYLFNRNSPPITNHGGSRKSSKKWIWLLSALMIVLAAVGVGTFLLIQHNKKEHDKQVTAEMEKLKTEKTNAEQERSRAQAEAEAAREEAARAKAVEDSIKAVRRAETEAKRRAEAEARRREEAEAQSVLQTYSVVVASKRSKSEAESYEHMVDNYTEYYGRTIPFTLGRKGRYYRVIAYTSYSRYDAEEARDNLRSQFPGAWIYTKN